MAHSARTLVSYGLWLLLRVCLCCCGVLCDLTALLGASLASQRALWKMCGGKIMLTYLSKCPAQANGTSIMHHKICGGII